MDTIDQFAAELRKWWSFDDRQMHTHSWHAREDFIERKLPDLLRGGWRTIDSAPRDGTDILLASWCLHDAPGGPFADYVVGSWDVEEAGGDGGWIDGHLEPIESEPTHWMPVPAPPSLTGDRS